MIWKTIEGAERYEVSEQGEIRSKDAFLKTKAGHFRFYKGKNISPSSSNQYGHLKCPVVTDEGAKKLLYVHQAVANAFIGKRPDGHYACHGARGHLVNSTDNISYQIPKKNSADKLRDGTSRTGENHPGSILTMSDVSEIKSLLGAMSQKEIAFKFGVSRTTISAISTGRTWSHGR